MTEKLRYAKTSNDAQIPTKGSKGAAGLDLYSVHECVILPLSQNIIDIGLKIALPAGCYGRIAPRSGLAAKYSLQVLAGVVDADYRGPISVILYNASKTDSYRVQKGDRVAQLILERIIEPILVEVTDLPSTERGCNKFGSTGW